MKLARIKESAPWWLVGIAVAVVIACIISTAAVVIDHSSNSSKILALEGQVKTLVQQDKTQSQRSATSSTEALAVVEYLIQTDNAMCTAVRVYLPSLNCPAVPTIP